MLTLDLIWCAAALLQGLSSIMSMDYFPAQMSGGEQQRVGFATAGKAARRHGSPRNGAGSFIGPRLLRANQASIQLTIEGADVTARPVAMTFLVPGFDAVAKARDQLDLLDRVLSPNRAPSSVPPRWTTRTRNLRDALITLDGRRAGASHKEIAIVIYGAEDVAADWRRELVRTVRSTISAGRVISTPPPVSLAHRNPAT